MVYLPVIGALLEAAGTILEKKILKKREIDYKNYTVYEFFAIVLVMLFAVGFFWRIDAQAWELKNLFILTAVIIVSILANLLIFYSLKRENITEFEPLWLMQPLFTVLLAMIFYSSERNWITVGLALAASAALVASHVKKHHLYLDRYAIAVLLGSFLFAVELVMSKLVLAYYSPFSLYFVRCLFIFIIAAVIFRPKITGVSKQTGMMIVAVGIMWVIYRIILYYGYETLGIVFTTMLFILSSVFMFIFAIVFLKEKPTWRQVVSTSIILVCVVLAIVYGGEV